MSNPMIVAALLLVLGSAGCAPGYLDVDGMADDDHADEGPMTLSLPVIATHDVRIPTGEGMIEGVAIEHEDGITLEGDILVDAAHIVSARDADAGFDTRQSELAALTIGLWPNGVIPYRIAKSARHRKADIEWAAKTWSDRTNVRIRPARASDTHFVRIQGVKRGCSSHIGRQPDGITRMKIEDRCGRSEILHEFGHALGLWHTQSRSDRGQYVAIKWANIADGQEFNFQSYVQQGFGDYSRDVGSYKTNSLMHYTSYAFSKNGRPTIVKRGETGASRLIGPNRKLTLGDANRVNRLYPR